MIGTWSQHVYMVCSTNPLRPIGTAFVVGRPGFVMTAAHVVAGQSEVVVRRMGENPRTFLVREVMLHERADIAMLRLHKPPYEFCYGVESRPLGWSKDHGLGTPVIAFGFPIVGMETDTPGRLMSGHIQCHLNYRRDHYDYGAYELSFPAFHNLSGSPLFIAPAFGEVLGVITDSVSYSSEYKGGHTAASWSIAASLFPLKSWITGIATTSG